MSHTTDPGLWLQLARLSPLAPPATVAQLGAAGDLLGVVLPSSLAEAYLVHDGSSLQAPLLPEGHHWLPLLPSPGGRGESVVGLTLASRGAGAEYIEDTGYVPAEARAEADAAGQRVINVPLIEQRIVIATDYAGTLLCVDTDPPAAGTVGQVVYIDPTEGAFWVAESLGAMFAQLLAARRRGEIAHDPVRGTWVESDSDELVSWMEFAQRWGQGGV